MHHEYDSIKTETFVGAMSVPCEDPSFGTLAFRTDIEQIVGERVANVIVTLIVNIEGTTSNLLIGQENAIVDLTAEQQNISCRLYGDYQIKQVALSMKTHEKIKFCGIFIEDVFYVHSVHMAIPISIEPLLIGRTADESEIICKGFSSLSEKQIMKLKDDYCSQSTPIQDDTPVRFWSFDELRMRYLLLKEQYPSAIRGRIEYCMSAYQTASSSSRACELRCLQYLVNINWSPVLPVFDEETFLREVNNSHYGMKKVKDRICELLITMQCSAPTEKKQRCLLLNGAAGTGKTSLVMMIASAMKIPYTRISLNGLCDDIILKGDSDCYGNANAGVIIRGAFDAGSTNYILVLDEIDKIGNSVNGQISNLSDALLDLLDGSKWFMDTFIGVPVSIENIIIIATSNDVSSIRPTLLDRMEVIEIEGYTLSEKIEITRKHVWPSLLLRYQLQCEEILIPDDAMWLLVTQYAYSSGIRDVEKSLESLLQYAIRQRSKGHCINRLDSTLITCHFGESKRIDKKSVPMVGVCHALGVCGNVGLAFPVQVVLEDGEDNIIISGLPSETVKDCCEIALFLARKNSGNQNKYRVHIHLGEGGVHKDGTSAGVAIYMAILSALKQLPIAPFICGTGEIDLLGNIHPIGGLVEKFNAAQSLGCTIFYMPQENYYDLQNHCVSAHDLKIVPVSHVKEIGHPC